MTDLLTDLPAARRLRAQIQPLPEEGDGKFRALISDYTKTYSIGGGWSERIRAGAFMDSIADRSIIPVNWAHDWAAGPIGDAYPAEVQLGLLATGQLYLDLDPFVQRIWRAMVNGAVTEWSIGFRCIAAGDITHPAGEPNVDEIVRGDLIEVSGCYRGMNSGTSTLQLASIDGGPQAAEREVARLRSVFGVPEIKPLKEADGMKPNRDRTKAPETAALRRERSLSFGDQKSIVYQALIVHLGASATDDDGEIDIWVEDLSTDWVVWYSYTTHSPGAGDWRLAYSMDADNVVTFTGTPEAVVEVSTWEPATPVVATAKTAAVMPALAGLRAMRKKIAKRATVDSSVAEMIESIDGIVDNLLDTLGLPDEDETDDETDDSDVDPELAARALDTEWGRELLKKRFASPSAS